MNFRPLWTASVWPTNSGTMVERRDHVFSTFFCRCRLSSSTRFSSRSSTYGPFLVERPMVSRSYFVRRVTMYRSDGRAPRRVLYPLVGLPHGVIGWLPLPLPSPPPMGWSTGFITVPRTVGLKPFQRTRPALPMDTFSWSRLPTWPIVARQDVGLGAGHDDVAGLEPERRDDVALLAVLVVQERDARRATRVVLDPLDHRRDADLFAPEIDVAQHALVPAAPVADGDAPVDVPPVRPLPGRQEALLRRLLRDLLVGEERHVAPGRRGGLERPDSHGSRLPRPARSCGRARASRPPSSSLGGDPR